MSVMKKQYWIMAVLAGVLMPMSNANTLSSSLSLSKQTKDLFATNDVMGTTHQTDTSDDVLVQIEQQIEQAILQQNWQNLDKHLAVYRGLPDFDEILYDYAQGAWLRKQGKQAQAIERYRTILKKNPDLVYVKLDLALMLIENREYARAKQLLDELEQASLSSSLIALLSDAKSKLEERERWTPSWSFNYESNDNINNASTDKNITWLGRQWQKDSSSLPISAKGIRYGATLSKEQNIGGNHNMMVEANLAGVAYWDKPNYSERTLKGAVGYKYADINKTWCVTSFAEQNWLGAKPYTQNRGLLLHYGRAIDQSSYFQSFANYTKKSYQELSLANRYNAADLGVGMSVSHRLSNGTLIYGGIDGLRERTIDPEMAFVRSGWHAGVTHDFVGGFGVNASMRYGKKTYDVPSTLVYNFIRQDVEYQPALTLWHKKLTWQGLRPELNIRHLTVESNMPAFYSRQGLSYFVSVEKNF